MKIFAFHLWNDYSGSPKVLSQLARGWIAQGLEVHIVTCSGRQGFLSDIPKARYHLYWYRWARNPFLRLFNLFLSQIILFWHMIFVVGRQDVVYVNTVLPFGAVWVGKLKGCKIIYHIHETSIKPALLKWFLFAWARWFSHKAVYVSRYLAEQEKMQRPKTHILYNAIEDDFLRQAKQNRLPTPNPQNVLMVCSLKAYKGVSVFVELARINPVYHFKLIVNASQTEIEAFFAETSLPTNLAILPTQTNLHPQYAWADVVLNLSLPDGWVETFGLTIIEGMAYGLPAIVPPVGGITELVQEGENGFQVNARNLPALSAKLNELLQNPALYQKMSDSAQTRIENYSEARFIAQSLAIIGIE
jgi:glycosyltransferase involved in cell wall biosynthesis